MRILASITKQNPSYTFLPLTISSWPKICTKYRKFWHYPLSHNTSILTSKRIFERNICRFFMFNWTFLCEPWFVFVLLIKNENNNSWNIGNFRIFSVLSYLLGLPSWNHLNQSFSYLLQIFAHDNETLIFGGFSLIFIPHSNYEREIYSCIVHFSCFRLRDFELLHRLTFNNTDWVMKFQPNLYNFVLNLNA